MGVEGKEGKGRKAREMSTRGRRKLWCAHKHWDWARLGPKDSLTVGISGLCRRHHSNPPQALAGTTLSVWAQMQDAGAWPWHLAVSGGSHGGLAGDGPSLHHAKTEACSRHLSEGHVPDAVVEMATGVPRAPSLAPRISLE